MADDMPEHIAALVRCGDRSLPLIEAKLRLGERLAWKGTPPGRDVAYDKTLTCWSLDGGRTHARAVDVLAAAGITERLR